MMDARQLRAQARDALRGKWGTAVLAGLLAMLLSSGIGSAMNSGATGQDMGLQQLEAMSRMIWMISSIGAVLSVVVFVIGGAIEMGYVHFNLRMIDGEAVRVGMVFEHTNRIGAGICMVLLRALHMLGWVLIPAAVTVGLTAAMAFAMPQETLLAMVEDPAAVYAMTLQILPVVLISCIPAVIASYRYLLMPYIMAEHPGVRARDALRLSVQMMRGLKWRAFCLQISFIGWEILSLATFGIGALWLQPYMTASQAAFYREICKFRKIQQPTVQPQPIEGPEF